MGYHEAIKRLTKEWRISSPTAVKELGWDPQKRSFIARGSHDVDDTTPKKFTMSVSTEWVFKNYGEKLAACVQKIGGILSGEEGIAPPKFFEVPSDKTGNLLKTDGVVITKYAFCPKDAMAFGSVCSDTTPGTYIGIMENGKQVTIADSELTKEVQRMLRDACNTGHDFVEPQNKDCVDLTKGGPAEFVKVEQMETACRIHRWEVMRVKHWPARTAIQKRYNDNGIRIYPDGAATYSEKFTGMLAHGLTVNLEESYVTKTFGTDFVIALRALSTKGKYVDIPVGSTKTSMLDKFPNLQLKEAPAMRYQQGQRETCLYSSFASVLYYIGYKVCANMIQQKAVGAREGGGVNSLKTLSNLVRHMAEIQFMNTRKTKPQFNWEIDLGTEMILVAVLQSEDGGVNHGVTIFGGYIFDSNEEQALPLCTEALDYCCSCYPNIFKFVRFHKGVIFEARGKKRIKDPTQMIRKARRKR